jgi:hypothetical protein
MAIIEPAKSAHTAVCTTLIVRSAVRLRITIVRATQFCPRRLS